MTMAAWSRRFAATSRVLPGIAAKPTLCVISWTLRLSRQKKSFILLFAPLGRELGGFSEWIFEVDPFIIAGELEQPQNIRWDIVRQMALYMVIIGQIDNLNRVEHIQQYTGCWAV